MAKHRICSIPGCGKKHVGRGYCSGHWKVWRKDQDESTLRQPYTGQPSSFLDAAIHSETNECIIWPFACTGRGNNRYGCITGHSAGTKPHRIVCGARNGPPPADKPLACHKCGNSLCINPRHIEWGSAADNAADAIEHGTTVKGQKNPNAKLSDQAAREIFLSVQSHRILAEQYGVTRTAVQQIQAGQTWKHATNGLTPPTGRLVPGSRWPKPRNIPASGPTA